MPHFDLSPVETRVLGCLLEKERTTPENYPISLNSLVAACNQSTNREPVTSFSEREVDEALHNLRFSKLATMIHAAGARVPKYRHNLPDHYDLQTKEVALLCVLMLRGAQTPGELRGRTDRLASFASLEEVESTLGALGRGDLPLVRVLPPQPGQKERRYVQLLTGEPSAEVLAPSAGASASDAGGASRAGRVEALETQVAELRSELAKLREEFSTFRQQFEN